MRVRPVKDLYEIEDIEFDGINSWDSPDYCDAYISAACWKDGTELTDEELDLLNDDHDFVYEKLYEYLY